MPGGDEIRDLQRAAWAGLSAGWEKWDSVIMDQLGPVGTAIIERLGTPGDQQHPAIAAGSAGPGMFRCAAPGYVSALYQAAGLREVAEWDVGVELVTRSPAQYWEMISEHASLAVAALQQVGEPARERIAKAVIAKASTYEKDG